MFQCRWANGKNMRSFGQGMQPVRQIGFQNPCVPATFAGDDQEIALARFYGRGKEPRQGLMRFNLRHAMQIDPRLKRDLALPQVLLGAVIEGGSYCIPPACGRD